MSASTYQFDLDFSGRHPAPVQEKIKAGMKAADDHAKEIWKAWFDACVMIVALRQYTLTSDDVLAEMESKPAPPGAPTTHNLSAIGPAMIRAARNKIITGTNEVRRSKRIEKNGNRQNVWISVVYRKDVQ